MMGSKNSIRIVVSCMICMHAISLPASDFDFREAEDSLRIMALNIVRPADDSTRLAHNALFFDKLLYVLQQQGAMSYPFDSLTTVSALKHPSRHIRIFTWYVPLQQERFSYFGLVQIGEPDTDQNPAIVVLNDSTQAISDPMFTELGADKWYGAYYYGLISHEGEEDTLFTLLGWKGDNPYTRKRVIEPVTFRQDTIVFGKQMFSGARGDPYRIVFEYASHVSMSLLYEEHFLDVRCEQLRPMIVFDRLAPMQEQFRGQYRYYVPEGNIFDALVFEEGRWMFYRDVDARSKRPEIPAE